MISLQYKTRGMSEPKGKPRVYFCCHQEDFEKYFESVSDEILAKQNCAVWYLDEDAERDEDFFVMLSEMQLFVMPVTRKLLCTENAAIDIEFQFAVENHIPVLPLIQETGLEQQFNQKCGELQFLDKCNTDITAISYDEKLEKYLSSVLIGDELAEKIRAAFDAYVFLSYRKKDRKYARELMRLIHKNEFCRDIAIWYDEFLTPGENFNDSIKEALQKSGLFVLTVTPNLVNESNYIMTTEYPMAKQEGKPILPTELVPTDKEQLLEKYEDIPACTDAHNEVALSKALFESIQKMAIKENDASPEHIFFIGLAYLGGVDVEVDYEKAESLITAAADAGLVEAADKLFGMYLNGVGVKRDYEKSTYWIKKKVDLLKEKCKSDGNENNYEELISSLIILGQHYVKNVAQYNEAMQVYMELHQVCTDIGERFDTDKFKRDLCDAKIHLAERYARKTDIDTAEKYANEANEILTVLKEEAERSSLEEQPMAYAFLLAKMASLCETLAEIEERKGGQDGERYLLQSLEYKLELEKFIKGNDNVRLNVAITYFNLARFYKETGNYEEALLYIDRGQPIADEIARSTGSLYAGEVFVRCLMLRGAICEIREDIQGALECYSTNVSNLERSSLTPVMVHLLLANYDSLKHLLYSLKRYKEAIMFSQRSLSAYKKIATPAQCKLKQIKNAEFEAKCYEDNRNRNEAMALYEQINDFYFACYCEARNAEFASNFMKSIFDLAEIYRRTYNYYPARMAYKRLINFCKEHVAQFKEIAGETNEWMVRAYDGMSQMYTQKENKLMAKIYNRKARKTEK